MCSSSIITYIMLSCNFEFTYVCLLAILLLWFWYVDWYPGCQGIILEYRVMQFVPITIIFKVEINKCIVMLHNQNWGRGARYACFDITEISILIKHSRFSILFFIYALTLLLLRRRLADTVKSNKNCNHNSDS